MKSWLSGSSPVSTTFIGVPCQPMMVMAWSSGPNLRLSWVMLWISTQVWMIHFLTSVHMATLVLRNGWRKVYFRMYSSGTIIPSQYILKDRHVHSKFWVSLLDTVIKLPVLVCTEHWAASAYTCILMCTYVKILYNLFRHASAWSSLFSIDKEDTCRRHKASIAIRANKLLRGIPFCAKPLCP